jgi:hypothetical protein
MRSATGTLHAFFADPAGTVEGGKSSFQLFCKPV